MNLPTLSVLLLSVALACPAHADLVARDGSTSVFITEKPCTHRSVLAQIKADFHELWRAGGATINGKAYMGCWAVLKGTVFLIYEDGDVGQVPVADFKRAPSI